VAEYALVVAGVALGSVLAWLIARAFLRAASLQTLTDELHKQLSARDLENFHLRHDLETERTQRAQAEARWEAARQNIEEQKRLLEGTREQMADTFKALSADALRQIPWRTGPPRSQEKQSSLPPTRWRQEWHPNV